MVDRRAPRGCGPGRGRELGRRRAEAAVDQAHHAARMGHAGLRLVGEALGRRGRRLGVVAPAQVLVGLVAPGGAELRARGVEERRVGGLFAAALAQELRFDRVERVDVGARERRRRRLVLRVPEVQAGEVHVDVVQQLSPLRAGCLDRLGLLRGRLVEDLLGRLVGIEAENELDGRHARDVDEPGDAVGARLVEQQRAVGRLDVAGAEEDAGVGVAVDVRDAVGVALDARTDRAHPGRRAGDGVAGDQRRVVLVDQRRRLVVAAAVRARHQLRVGDVAEEWSEAVVHARLRLGGQQAGARAPGHAGLPLAVRDHVQGGDSRSRWRQNADHDHGERERTSQDDSSSGHAGRGRPTMARHATTARVAIDTLSSSAGRVSADRRGRAVGVAGLAMRCARSRGPRAAACVRGRGAGRGGRSPCASPASGAGRRASTSASGAGSASG